MPTLPFFENSDSLAPLKVPAFRLFLCASFCSPVAAQMISVACGCYIYDVTHSPLNLGILGLASFFPAFLVSFWAGEAADRLNRHHILASAFSGQAVCACVLLMLVRGDGGNPSSKMIAIFVIAGVSSALRALTAPASQALMTTFASPDKSTTIVAWCVIVWQSAMIVGPALGGWLYGLSVSSVFTLSVSLFVISALAVLQIHLSIRMVPSQRVPVRTRFNFFPGSGLVEGYRFAKKESAILSAMLLDLFAMGLGGTVALLPVFARDILHVGPSGVGWLRCAPALGAMMAAFALASRPLIHRIGVKILVAVFVFGLATIVFALSTHFYVSMCALVAIGAADAVSIAVRHTLIQMSTPNSMRGRVSALNQMFVLCSDHLGEFESGATAAWLGVVPATLAGGIGACVVALMWSWIFPSLRKVQFGSPRPHHTT